MQHNLAVNDKLNKVWSLFTPRVVPDGNRFAGGHLGFGIWQLSKQQITVGVLTAFIAYIGALRPARLDEPHRLP
jgi:ATP-binding cassette subfamily B protein